MTIKMPAISIKLDSIRRTAHALYKKGFRDEALELMRISRGEVKLEAGSKLFGLTASDIKKAKTCTLQQRLIVAANIVDSTKFGVTEDDYDEAVSKIAAGNTRYPKRNPKDVIIKTVAQKHQVNESSLKTFMKKNKVRIPVNVNSHSCERERHFFSTHHPDRFLPQLFTFSQLTPWFCA